MYTELCAYSSTHRIFQWQFKLLCWQPYGTHTLLDSLIKMVIKAHLKNKTKKITTATAAVATNTLAIVLKVLNAQRERVSKRFRTHKISFDLTEVLFILKMKSLPARSSMHSVWIYYIFTLVLFFFFVHSFRWFIRCRAKKYIGFVNSPLSVH